MMDPIKVKKFRPRNAILKNHIKYFWVIRAENVQQLSYKLLPVNNVDIVLNFSSPMLCHEGVERNAAPEFSFTGIRNHHQIVDQAGDWNIFGVSFFPAGFYPFLKMPLSEFTNQTIDYCLCNKNFRSEMEGRFHPEGSMLQQIEVLEDIFLQSIDADFVPENRTILIINAFCAHIHTLKIKDFCDEYGIRQRKLERLFRRHIGVNPKSFQRISRFQGALNRLLRPDLTDLTKVAHDSLFYDQAHFIHDFQFFSGCSPSHFLNEKRSMMQLLTN